MRTLVALPRPSSRCQGAVHSSDGDPDIAYIPNCWPGNKILIHSFVALASCAGDFCPDTPTIPTEMAQTECSVSTQVVAGSSLQISPNLEALLQHDELTRRSAGSPTSLSCSTSSSEFAVSLPPPPPRNSQPCKKTSSQETRTKDVRRRRSVNFRSDSWPDALSILAPDSAASQAIPASPTITPNPYINPAPVVARFDSPTDDDGPPTPRQRDMHIPKQRSVQSLAEHRARVSSIPESGSPLTRTSSNPRSSPAFHKVERLLTKGKDSLSMLATAAASGSLKLKSDSVDVDRKCYRVDSLESFPTIKDSPIRQDSVTGPPRLFNTSVSFGNDDATAVEVGSLPIKNKLPPSPLTRGHPGSGQPLTHPTQSEPSPTRSLSISSTSSTSSSVNGSANPVHTYPTWSLPNLTFPSMTFNELQRSQSTQSISDNDSRKSFIDFHSPDSNSPRKQGNSRPHRQQPSALVIPTSNMYQSPPSNFSSVSLATMIFAPPSPAIDLSPLIHRPSSPSASSIALSTMVFAPPSPATELSPLAVRPPTSPGSADSLTPIEFASPASPPSGRRAKLEIPTTRKLSSLRVRRRAGEKRSLSLSPRPASQELAPLPPTTNLLRRDERADLIRRNRKLIQVFGQTPVAEPAPLDVPMLRRLKKSPAALTSLLGAAKQRNHRQVMSLSNATSPSHPRTGPPSPWQMDELWSPSGRRHSTPLTPTSAFSFSPDDAPRTASASDNRGVHSLAHTLSPRNSSSSFIDLSDDDETSRVDDISVINSLDRKHGRRLIHHSSSTPSLVESLNPDRRAEVERRRMRDKVAKLHRFLGSRVPPDLVLGPTTFPPPPCSSSSTMEGLRDAWPWSRKGGASPSQDIFDRRKEELDQREKAVNVRRAQKMEKVFGTPPPQTLFHTRQGPSTLPHSQPSSPVVSAPTCNLNQSAYKGKSPRRPQPSESMRCLLPRPNTEASSLLSDYQQTLAQTSVYLNYHHSLNSLVHIIDRDDRESLLELHRYLNSELSESPVEGDQPVSSKCDSTTPSIRSERRHSLPVSVSTFSLASEVFSYPQEVSDFQVRRRRAAKLTSFFGVNYRELIEDILESIERGVEEEHGKGTLQLEEAEVLLHRVRSLKTKQDQYD
ncbi:hypothetical protein SCLCIDRAFT_509107 [Scleroderma citrinum Foug A]|uniref:Uncharacterized protein n=1 Tax=Scleroderma citrinum Foug A TaxID=1036808 RepID=A0A0C3EPT6_9AGAM|nr:hypothetical protein SCLCIDRAFT_509107 [Scleroderma citrinum Foug A]